MSVVYRLDKPARSVYIVDMEITTNGGEMTTETNLTPADYEALALDAENRVQPAATETEREFWYRLADYYWGKA
jgi:hypothetical protein